MKLCAFSKCSELNSACSPNMGMRYLVEQVNYPCDDEEGHCGIVVFSSTVENGVKDICQLQNIT